MTINTIYKICVAAELGDLKAQCELGDICRSGLDPNPTEAAKWYRKAAELGDAESQFHLGGMYKYGTGGLPQNRVEAEKWYRKAAEQGHANSQFELGRMYDLEGGLPKTTTKL